MPAKKCSNPPLNVLCSLQIYLVAAVFDLGALSGKTQTQSVRTNLIICMSPKRRHSSDTKNLDNFLLGRVVPFLSSLINYVEFVYKHKVCDFYDWKSSLKIHLTSNIWLMYKKKTVKNINKIFIYVIICLPLF